MALRFAGYGYILEAGLVVMDGFAEEQGPNQDVREFYLGMSEVGCWSLCELRSCRRCKRWLS